MIIKKIINIHLSEDEKKQWLQSVNEKFTGEKQVPLNQKVSEEHLDITRHIIAGFPIEVEFLLENDGTHSVISAKTV